MTAPSDAARPGVPPPRADAVRRRSRSYGSRLTFFIAIAVLLGMGGVCLLPDGMHWLAFSAAFAEAIGGCIAARSREEADAFRRRPAFLTRPGARAPSWARPAKAGRPPPGR
ncbi:MAG TPA: hypothetical protein VEI02_04685 [Planctomycetota bacterium]|nr:hypothetical protein [Planctomycetota bacterium]